MDATCTVREFLSKLITYRIIPRTELMQVNSGKKRNDDSVRG